MIRLDFTPSQAEFIYWELLALQAHYDAQNDSNPLTTEQSLTLAKAVTSLATALDKAEALANVQLEHLKRQITSVSGQ